MALGFGRPLSVVVGRRLRGQEGLLGFVEQSSVIRWSWGFMISHPNFRNSPGRFGSNIPILPWERFREGKDARKVTQRAKSKAGV